jgi:hypothetical protein
MSGQIVGGIIGGVIGFFVPPIGIAMGFAIGSVVGGIIAPASSRGPDLTDLRPQSSEYGRPIPIVYGTVALGGNVIWAADLIKTSDGGGGGKGGGNASGGATYAANFAVLICEADGNVNLGRIWAGPEKRLVYDPSGSLEDTSGIVAEVYSEISGLSESGTFTFYDGSAMQAPDPLIEAALGAGNVPAYRGYAYVVIEGFDVTKHDGNRIPFLTIEVGNVEAERCPVAASEIDGVPIYDPPIERIAVAPDDISMRRIWQDQTTGLVYFNYEFDGAYYLGRVASDGGGTIDHGDSLYLGTSATNFAWDGHGTAAYTRGSYPSYGGGGVSLEGWGLTPGLGLALMNVGASVMYCPVRDIAYDFVTGEYKYLSSENKFNGLYQVYSGSPIAMIAMNDSYFPEYSINWHAHGERVSASLIQMYPNGSGAASFPLQASNYSTTSTTWNGYDSRRRMLVAFDGAASAVSYVFDDGTYVFNSGINTHHEGTPISAGTTDVAYLAQHDLFAVHTGVGGGIYLFDPSNISGTDWPARACILHPVGQGYADGSTPGWSSLATIFPMPNDPDYVGMWSGGTGEGGGHLLKVPIGAGSITPGGVLLSEVVTDLSLRAGLSVGDIDVEQLTDTVDGYALASQMAVKDAISALMPVYFFDAVEDQGQIRYIKRGGDLAAEIPDADLGANEAGSDDGADRYTTERRMDEELPHTFSVSYVLAATKYSMATKYARRLIGNSGTEVEVQLPLVLTDQKAAEVAQVNLYEQWVGRIGYGFKLGREYSYLMPTDLIGIGGYVMRVISSTLREPGVYEMVAVRDNSDTYTPVVIVDETPELEGESIAVGGGSTLALL